MPICIKQFISVIHDIFIWEKDKGHGESIIRCSSWIILNNVVLSWSKNITTQKN